MQSALIAVVAITLLDYHTVFQTATTSLPELVVQGALTCLLVVLLILDCYYHFLDLGWSVAPKNSNPYPTQTGLPAHPLADGRVCRPARHLNRRGVLCDVLRPVETLLSNRLPAALSDAALWAVAVLSLS